MVSLFCCVFTGARMCGELREDEDKLLMKMGSENSENDHCFGCVGVYV